MSATIWNGESRSLSIETGKKLTVSAMSGTYSVLTTAGDGAGTALASNAMGGTYGPYAGPITVLLSSSALSEIDFDVAVTPVIESDTFVKASKTLTGGLDLTAGGVPVPIISVLAQSAVPVSVTGTVSETVLASIPIPAGLIGLNGRLRISWAVSYTNSVNNKLARIKLLGTTLATITRTTSAQDNRCDHIANRNSLSSQLFQGAYSSSAQGAGFQTAFAIDTSAAGAFDITGQLTNTGETLTLESYLVELIK